jgi:hypothetical protein
MLCGFGAASARLFPLDFRGFHGLKTTEPPCFHLVKLSVPAMIVPQFDVEN